MNLKNKSIINTFVPVGDLYHWYGMGYTNCSLETGIIPPQNCPGIYFEFGHCGFRTDHAVNLYTSPDLENWTFIRDIFPKGARPDGIYFRYKRISLDKMKVTVTYYLPILMMIYQGIDRLRETFFGEENSNCPRSILCEMQFRTLSQLFTV